MKEVLSGARAAAADSDLVRVVRAKIGGLEPLDGFVIDTTDSLLLLQLLSNRIDLDGYAILRVQDITALEREFERKTFYLTGLRLKGCTAQRPEGINLADLREAVRSVQATFSVLVIHRERITPDECEIGQIKLTFESTYALRWLSPDATWQDDNRRYKYSDITRIDFGGEYERTLALVANARVQASGVQGQT